MIRGVDVWVSYASDENGYVELTPEAANNPWAVIGEWIINFIGIIVVNFLLLLLLNHLHTAADRG